MTSTTWTISIISIAIVFVIAWRWGHNSDRNN